MLWVKVAHIFFVLSWFAGLFYLPRLFVYHAMAADRISIDRFKVMERKLYRGIMTPSAILAVASGLWLWLGWFSGPGGETPRWLQLKMALVVLLVGYHFWCGRLLRDFAAERNAKTHVWLRWFNEAPVLVLVGIIVLVVLKPL